MRKLLNVIGEHFSNQGKHLMLLLLMICCFSCQTKVDQKVDNSTSKVAPNNAIAIEEEVPEEIFDINEHIKNYERLKSSIADHKKEVKNNSSFGQDEKLGIAKDYLSKILIDSIFPNWLGTKWDFNGITERPKDGVIACGYFVSTTLRDVGIRLNRYKVAQKGAAEIIAELCEPSKIKRINSFEKLIEHLKGIADYEVLVVGLDYHVGFVFKKNNIAFFAHSNYIDREGVVIEVLEDSEALKNTNVYVLGNFSKNNKMMRNWLN